MTNNLKTLLNVDLTKTSSDEAIHVLVGKRYDTNSVRMTSTVVWYTGKVRSQVKTQLR